MIPKVELHVHLEGAASPILVKRLAQHHHFSLPSKLFNTKGNFNWNNFSDFLTAYDIASEAIRTSEDYCKVTYDYLAQSAKEGVIYTELSPSPDHAALAGMSYTDLLEGVTQGIEEAHEQYGIESRIIITAVRHFGKESVTKVAQLAAKYPHPLVVGFGLGGDEINYPAPLFTRAYHIAQEAGLGCTIHAGEWTGPNDIRDAITHLPVTRLGHGVRIIEDPTLIQEIIERDITLECAPTSNIALGVYPNYSKHPLADLYNTGVKITLNSDDPPYFSTTIGNEYHIAKKHFGFTDTDLLKITETAIKASFVDNETQQRLLEKIKRRKIDNQEIDF